MLEVTHMCGSSRRRRVIINQPVYQQVNETQYVSPRYDQNRIKVDSNFTFCLNCNFAKNIKEAKFCQQCGKELQTCPISKMNFSQGQEYVQCTNCKWVFHKTHIDNWMKTNQTCPICDAPPKLMNVGLVGSNPVQK